MDVNTIFRSFINDITNVFPEYKKRIDKYYNEVFESEGSGSDHPKIVEFLKNIHEISDKIIDKDIHLFDEDPIILQNVSFKLLWNSDITSQTKNSIWKYLQTFCIINIRSESSDEKINEVIRLLDSNEKVKDKDTVKNMKKLKRLNETFDIQELEKVINENPESIDDGIQKMDSMFENTSIGKIAKEITQDLDIENIIGNGGGMEDLLSGGGIANIMKTITSKMSDKEGQLDTEQLMKEATTICGSMEGNPLFSSLMGMQGGLFKEAAQSQGQDQGRAPDTKQINLNKDPHDSDITKERLKRKLKEKKEKKENMTIEKLD